MTLQPLVNLFDLQQGQAVDLPEELAEFYGTLRFPERTGSYVITNFVSTMDGVVSLSIPGHDGGGDISGFYPPDQAVMGLLRACADAVIVGASQLRRPPGTIWLPDHVYPAFGEAYFRLRKSLGKNGDPLQVVVTASGKLDLALPIFNQNRAQVLILTTPDGQQKLEQQKYHGPAHIRASAENEALSGAQILAALTDFAPVGLALVEGGPRLVRHLIAEQLLDEIFLTLAPQIAGRDSELQRPGFTFGQIFAPHDPRWCQLVSLKQSENYLFLRYALTSGYTKSGSHTLT